MFEVWWLLLLRALLSAEIPTSAVVVYRLFLQRHVTTTTTTTTTKLGLLHTKPPLELPKCNCEAWHALLTRPNPPLLPQDPTQLRPNGTMAAAAGKPRCMACPLSASLRALVLTERHASLTPSASIAGAGEPSMTETQWRFGSCCRKAPQPLPKGCQL
jgi:hypothetical protein